MSISDPIADALISIKNSSLVKKDTVIIKYSKMLERICQILKEENFIENYKKIEDNKQGLIKIYLKYKKNKPLIREVRRISKPSRRIYVSKEELNKFLKGYGVTILSTSRGVLSGKEAKRQGVGGELICQIW